MDSNQLKERGNAFIRQGKYSEALECYTGGLEIDPSNYALLSNRSLALLRMGRVEEALADAEKCTVVARSFARGHLRRAMALSSMGRHEDAIVSAEEGYKLRQSDTVCKECVSQWLVANQSIHKGLVQRYQSLIPPGCLILSEKIGEIVLHINALRNSAAGMTPRSMQDYLMAITTELENLLAKFGHKCSPCLQEWVNSLPSARLLDPETDRIPREIAESVIQKGDDLTKWILSHVDPILYPLVGPVASLYPVIISNRAHTLSAMNIGHQERQVICKSVLPLFKGLLGNDEYIAAHVGLLLGLLGSFLNRRNNLSLDDCQEIHAISQETKTLLEKLPVGLMELKRHGLHGLAKADECLKVAQGSNYITGSIQLGSREVFGKMDAAEVVSMVSRHMAQLEAKPPLLLTLEGPQHMLRAAYFLADAGQNELAVKAFHAAERLYYKVFGQKMSLGLWSVDEMGSTITQPRSMILEVANKLASIDVEVLTDAIVRWKCLHTEFVALLMQAGMGATYQSTYRELFESRKELDQNAMLQIASTHRQSENKLAELHGPTALSILFVQSYNLIQGVLEKDEVVLEYCHLGASIDDGKATEANGVVVMIKPEGKPVKCSFSFDELFHLSHQWHPLLSTAANTLTDHSPEADRLSHRLCDLLFPPPVREVIESDQVKRVYFCPEVQIAQLPLDLLTFPDKQLLFQKCAITLVSSSREIIRYDAALYLEKLISQGRSPSAHRSSPEQSDTTPEDQGKNTELISSTTNPEPQPPPPHDTCAHVNSKRSSETEPQTEDDLPRDGKVELPRRDETASAALKTNKCIIFANPNFGLEVTGRVTKTLADAMKSIFGLLFRSPLGLGPAKSLPATQEEASSIERILTGDCPSPFFSVQKFTGDDATVKAALEVQSPYLLHFATHAFSCVKPGDYRHQPFGISFWESTTSGLLLAGANTCSSGKYDQISSEAGSGQLASLAICGMNLKNTRLVYLSVCSASAGHIIAGESAVSLAQAFRAAGAHSVIATRWPVDDTASKAFSMYFYSALSKKGVHPSEALVSAKEAMRQDSEFNHWLYWAPYVCIGYDFPLFATN